VFGVGLQEMVLIGLLSLIIFGPSKLPQMARELGQFVNEARRAVDEWLAETEAPVLLLRMDEGRVAVKPYEGWEQRRPARPRR